MHLVLADICRQIDTPDDSPGDVDSDDKENNYVDILFLALDQNEGPAFDRSEMDEDEINIFVTSYGWSETCGQDFEGACVDSGSEGIVVGRPQAHTYFDQLKKVFKEEKALKRLSIHLGHELTNILAELRSVSQYQIFSF